MGELLARDQQRRLAIGRLQPSDRALQPDRIVKVAPVRRRCEACNYRKALWEGAERAAAAAKVARCVEGDAAQPGGELRLAAIATDLLDQRAAHVLRDI